MKQNFANMLRAATGTFLVASVFGGLTSCTDDYELDDDGVSPGYTSIYALLKDPGKSKNQEHPLTGTFENYLRLVNDLSYADVFDRTGSKTVFPANDEAFARFYQNNSWGVTKYEDFTEQQKIQLLYGSMIDNAMLTGMLSNIQSGNTVNRGQAMRHHTALQTVNAVNHFSADEASQIPQNNSFWDRLRSGVYYVADESEPSMVHFTREHMLQNNITTAGTNSDFEVITGTKYDENLGTTYIFRVPVTSPNVRALNGYVHQVGDVLVPQPNIAEVIRTNGESNYFSRMLDRFSVPIYQGNVTRNYNDNAELHGQPKIDSIFAKKYFNSQKGHVLRNDDQGNVMNYVLEYDPGWNAYAPENKNEQADMCAIFVPTDEAMEKYFLPGGGGAFILQQYGKKDNTRENLNENIDSIPINLVQKLVMNLMKTSFIETVPSKFGTVLNDATEPMGLTLDNLNRNEDGTYDVKIANNGVAYMLNSVIAPDDYQCVYAPATIMQDMVVMRKAIEDGQTDQALGLDLNFYAYLKAMRANYALFIPKDVAFASGQYYVDPAYLGHLVPRALKFYITIDVNGNEVVNCSQWRYDPLTNEVGDSIGMVTTTNFKTQLTDILNYSTIVLPTGMTLENSGNRYFKTKHGGEILFEKGEARLGGQIDNGLDASKVIETYPEKNGVAYVVDRVLQAPRKSVYDVLTDQANTQFAKFEALCNESDIDKLLIWADAEHFDGKTESGKEKTLPFNPFVAKNGLSAGNMNYFSSYNYTFYFPNNDAMDEAYKLGLPQWDKVKAIKEKWDNMAPSDEEKINDNNPDSLQHDKDRVLAMINQINAFIRYHVQNNSIYADNTVMSDNLTPVSTTGGDEFATAYANLSGIRMKLRLTGGKHQFTVTDAAGKKVVVSENSGLMVNQMTRDYVFDKPASSATSISTSSFAVIHEIDHPLVFEPSGRFDGYWTGGNAARKLARVRTLFNENFNKRY